MVRFLQDVSNDVDRKLNNRTIKRPDASYTIKPSNTSNSRPSWMKLKPNGIVYLSIVVEVAVVMSDGRATPGSRPGTDRLFCVSDRVRVIIVVIRTDFRSSSSYNS